MENASKLEKQSEISQLDIDETLEQLVAIYGEDGRRGMWPTRSQWRTFLENPDPGKILLHKFVMFNRDYVDDGSYDDEEVRMALLDEYGAVTIHDGIYESVWLGDSDEKWDFVQIMQFPNRQSLTRFMLDPRILPFNEVREKMVIRQKTLVSHPAPPVQKKSR